MVQKESESSEHGLFQGRSNRGLLVLLGGHGAALECEEEVTAWTGARVMTMEGHDYPSGTLVVQNGKILAVGSDEDVVPPPGARVIKADGKIIMPGLICTHSHIGGIGGADSSHPIQPDVRIHDSINVRDSGFKRAVAGGLTTLNIMPGSGHLLGGQTIYVKLRRAETIDDMMIRADDGWIMGGLKMANGTNPIREASGFPGTRGKSAALVRQFMIRAREYGEKIVAVGPADQVVIPPDAEVLEAKVVTPGLIDAHATAGLTGIFNQSQDQDQLDSSEAVQPELRALDAINIQEELVGYLRGFGVTTLHNRHASRELISGQTLIVKTVGQTVEQALVRETAAVVATLGPAARRNQGSPGTRGKQMAMLRQELIKAGEYAEKVRRAEQRDPEGGDSEQDETNQNGEDNGEERDKGETAKNGAEPTPPSRDLRLEALAQVLDGQVPLLVTANKAQDIASALRLADEFGIRIWLDGAAEAYLLVEEIKRAQVPVLLHPTMIRATGEYESLSFETAAQLVKAGIPVAMQSGYEGYVPKVRVVLFEAAITAAHGLSFEQALATITIDAARILGIADHVGSLEVGKDADIALYDGDPFEYTSRCIGVLVNGRPTGDPVR